MTRFTGIAPVDWIVSQRRVVKVKQTPTRRMVTTLNHCGREEWLRAPWTLIQDQLPPNKTMLQSRLSLIN